MVQEQKKGKRKGEVKDVEKKVTALCPHTARVIRMPV